MALRRRGAERRGTPADLLVVGLANPGEEYAHTRHNIGGDAVERLCEERGGALKVEPRQRARLCELRIGPSLVALAVPTTYMNESGAALPGILDRTGIDEPSKVLVVHDEIDFEPGRLQLKLGGGLAGHNGLRSISSVLKTKDFFRLRIGVGRPPSPQAGASWVLSRPRGKDAELLEAAVVAAADAISLVATEGFERAMGLVNVRG